MNPTTDQRLVMTLDAGGTNFVFSAIRAGQEATPPITLPSNGSDLPRCLETIITGFTKVQSQLSEKPVAISFAFPGPADYANGIIGDLVNLPSFRGGVALGPMLRDRFALPVFMNNDGDLFAYGEAISGFLPWVNNHLEKAGSPKRFANLFGITLGTGFGGGIVRNGQLFLGDNGAAGEVWSVRHKLLRENAAEDGASIRAVRRVYAEHAGISADDLTPKDIHDIAHGRRLGDRSAAQRAFHEMGEVVGDAVANAITLIDGLVVVGGGLSGAADLILPPLVNELNSTILSRGNPTARTEVTAFNLDDHDGLQAFLRGDLRQIVVPGSTRTIPYDPLKRIGVGTSKLGTSRAIALGAYAYALAQLG